MSAALSRSLSFLRSRSAPPTPRDANTPRIAPPGVSGEIPVLELSEDEKGSMESGEEEGAMVVGGDDNEFGVGGIVSPVPQLITSLAPTLGTGGRTPPRSASPGPTLEAILLDRKRRVLLGYPAASVAGAPVGGSAATSGSGTPIPGLQVTPLTSAGVGVLPPSVLATPPVSAEGAGLRAPKKGGFKSSPLTTFDGSKGADGDDETKGGEK